MSSNVKTLKRVRRTHVKFAALNLNAEDGGGMGMDEPPETAEEDPVDEFVDERPWKVRVGLRDGDVESGIELGGERAADCLRWTNGKVLEHAGFQGECLLQACSSPHLVISPVGRLFVKLLPRLVPWIAESWIF
jgi:transcriptional activator SPT7